MARRKNTEQENQNRTEQLLEGRSFVYLVMFIKLVFRQSNTVFIGILSLLIVKTNLAIFCC